MTNVFACSNAFDMDIERIESCKVCFATMSSMFCFLSQYEGEPDLVLDEDIYPDMSLYCDSACCKVCNTNAKKKQFKVRKCGTYFTLEFGLCDDCYQQMTKEHGPIRVRLDVMKMLFSTFFCK